MAVSLAYAECLKKMEELLCLMKEQKRNYEII